MFDAIADFVVVLSLAGPLFLYRWNRLLVAAHKETEIAEAEASHIALHDPLTGLHNRRSYQLQTQKITASGWANPDKFSLSLLLIDLDRFKPVNDLRGHAAGDALLCEFAERLRNICSKSCDIYRLGGDEFAILVRGSGHDEDSGPNLARRLLTEMRRAFIVDDWSVVISCSIGIAQWEDGMTGQVLLRHADQAMYLAKDNGRGSMAHYDNALGARLRDTAQLEADLREAVSQNHIRPYFQPVYDIADNTINGFEVLARWEHAERGFVPPDIFIGLAEDMGLIDEMSDRILDEACRALMSWPTNANLSFNISPCQFSNENLADRIGDILTRNGMSGDRLEIEITERAVIADMERARTIINQLAIKGVRISLDDFGTGTSSLATLTQLPISKIKIDRSFVTDVDTSKMNAKIVSGVLALAESLSLEVTAEGIEHETELEFLRARNCTLGQGYLLCRPCPADDIPKVLAEAAGREMQAKAS
ncbi:MAG: EAL domain-containing protein [Rhodobacteraceae bacterium]|nr:EAL domain-containing protein [Paracoccaceae bacterium]